MDITRRKKELRQRIRAAERILTAEFRERSDEAVVSNILSLQTYQNARTVFLFVSYGREINTAALLEDAFQQGKRVTVPLCTGDGIMEAKEIRSVTDLRPGFCGIPEPPKELPTVPFGEVDFALIPCYSCDRDGRRLGKGGGYYDRFLEKYEGSSAIVVRECLMNYDIPMEEHDASIHPVVTDHKIYW